MKSIDITSNETNNTCVDTLTTNMLSIRGLFVGTCCLHGLVVIKAGIAEWLDHLNLLQSVPGSKPPSRPKSVRRELILCNSRKKGERNHEVWPQREKGPGSHCSIRLPIQWALGA